MEMNALYGDGDSVRECRLYARMVENLYGMEALNKEMAALHEDGGSKRE